MGKKSRQSRERFQYNREIKVLNEASSLYDHIYAVLVETKKRGLAQEVAPPEAVFRFTPPVDSLDNDCKRWAIDCRPPYMRFYVEFDFSNTTIAVMVDYYEVDFMGRWQICTEVLPLARANGKFYIPPCANHMVYSLLDENGLYLGSQDVEFHTVDNRVEQIRGDNPKEIYDIVTVLHAQTLRLISLANCRNIETITHIPDEKLSRLHEKHYGVPMTKYKTLTLKQNGKRANNNNPQEYQDIMPLHMRRGHPATYTEVAPLFGKYTGTFWRPATAVGSEKNGIVVKDYKVVSTDGC